MYYWMIVEIKMIPAVYLNYFFGQKNLILSSELFDS